MIKVVHDLLASYFESPYLKSDSESEETITAMSMLRVGVKGVLLPCQTSTVLGQSIAGNTIYRQRRLMPRTLVTATLIRQCPMRQRSQSLNQLLLPRRCRSSLRGPHAILGATTSQLFHLMRSLLGLFRDGCSAGLSPPLNLHDRPCPPS